MFKAGWGLGLVLRSRAEGAVLASSLQHSQPLKEAPNPRPVIPPGFERVSSFFCSQPGPWGFTICFVPSVLGPEPGVQAGLSLEGGGRGQRVRGVREACRGGQDVSVSELSHTPLPREREGQKARRDRTKRDRHRDGPREPERKGGRGECRDVPWADSVDKQGTVCKGVRGPSKQRQGRERESTLGRNKGRKRVEGKGTDR